PQRREAPALHLRKHFRQIGEHQLHLPDVPTLGEAGFPDLNARSWFGLFVPAATPAPVVDTLSKAIVQAVASPTVQARLKELGADPVGDDHAAFQAYVQAEVVRWGDLVKKSGAKAE
ncbi:MAG: hypothetical protein EOO27_30495, partial [Comamonadaceae bacterium]